jgi:hypothetical protein
MQQRMSLAQFAGRPTLVFAKADAGPTGGTVAAPSFDPGARGVHSTQQRRCAGGICRASERWRTARSLIDTVGDQTTPLRWIWMDAKLEADTGTVMRLISAIPPQAEYYNVVCFCRSPRASRGRGRQE